MPQGAYKHGYTRELDTPVAFAELSAAPTQVSDKVLVYGFDDGGVTQLYARLSDGTTLDLTPSGGAAPSDAPYLTNGAVVDLSAEVDVTAAGAELAWRRVVAFGAAGYVRWSAGTAVVAGEYSIQRDADATNQLHSNVPTGAGWEWSVNDVAVWTLTATAWTHTQAVGTSGSPVAWTLTGGAHTTLAASTEATDIFWNLARSVEFASGAITDQRAIRIDAPTYAFVLPASTITRATTLYISGAPIAGANATITSGYVLWTDDGLNRFDGQVQIGAGTAGAPGIAFQVDTNTGIRRNDEDEIDVVAGGASRLRVDTAGIRVVTGTVRIEDLGSAAVPAVQLTADPNTGLFWSAADVLGLSAGATAMALFNGVNGSSTAAITLTQPVSTSGAPTLLAITGALHTTLAASAEATDVLFDLGRIVQHATGALAAQRAVWFEAPTYSFVGASTITDAATVYIEGAPAAGANATITQGYALWIDAGRLRADDGILIGGEPAGVAGFVGYSNTVDNSGNSTGVGTILFKGATNRNSSGFLKILDGATARFIPYFDAITG